MKRVIDGVTYNTDTSTIVAKYEYEDDQDRKAEAVLYKTRGGAFYIVHKKMNGGPTKENFETITIDEAHSLPTTIHNIIIIDDKALNVPLETKEEPEATLYLRIPRSLKNRIDAAAKEANLSSNSWALRCMENCLASKNK